MNTYHTIPIFVALGSTQRGDWLHYVSQLYFHCSKPTYSEVDDLVTIIVVVGFSEVEQNVVYQSKAGLGIGFYLGWELYEVILLAWSLVSSCVWPKILHNAWKCYLSIVVILCFILQPP